MAVNTTVIPSTATVDENTLTKNSGVISFSDKSVAIQDLSIRTLAEHEIKILEVDAATSVTPLITTAVISDTFSDSNGLNNSLESTTGGTVYNSSNDYYESVAGSSGTVSFGASGTNSMDNIGGNNHMNAYKITIATTRTITSAKIYIKTITGTPGDLIARVETVSGSYPSGTLADPSYAGTLAQGSVTTSADNTITFVNPVALAPGDYFLVFDGAATSGSNYYETAMLPVGSGALTYYTANGGASWASVTTQDLRCGYNWEITGGSGTISVDLGDLNGQVFNGIYIATHESEPLLFDITTNGESYTSNLECNAYIEQTFTFSTSSNFVRFQLPVGSWIKSYAVLLFQ